MAGQRQKLIDKQIERVVADARLNLDQGEAKMRSLLGCGSIKADPGSPTDSVLIQSVVSCLPHVCRTDVFIDQLIWRSSHRYINAPHQLGSRNQYRKTTFL